MAGCQQPDYLLHHFGIFEYRSKETVKLIVQFWLLGKEQLIYILRETVVLRQVPQVVT